MQNQNVQDIAPDWAVETKDLLCPLCEYNLRGLSQPRCPECGFTFTWRELIDAEKNRHLYLFEYGKGRNLISFWKTFWRTCLPRRFWTDLSPAQEVKVFRLLLYWVLSSIVMLGVLVTPVWMLGYQTCMLRTQFVPVPGKPGLLQAPGSSQIPAAQLDFFAPPVWDATFWNRALQELGRGVFNRSQLGTFTFGWAAVYLLWPLLTLFALLVFRYSMRKAKIRRVHLLRTVIYSCDFSVLMLVIASGLSMADLQYHNGPLLVAAAVVAGVITSYRLTIAFDRYLRVHLPLATVLASQVIAFLIVFILLVEIADFTRVI